MNNSNNYNISEYLFFKVIRNKYLFNKIFSNFRFKYTHQYSRLHNVEYIFRYFSNGEAIIRDKVKSESFLTILDNSKDYEGFKIICDTIRKDNQENRELIQKIISKYSSTETNANDSNIISRVLSSKNILVLKTLNFKFNDGFAFNRFISINDYKSLKMVKYLYSNGLSNGIRNISVVDSKFYKKSFKLKHLVEIVLYFKEIHPEYERIENFDGKSNLEILNQFTNDQLKTSIIQLLGNSSSLINNNSIINGDSSINNSLKLKILKLLNFVYLFQKSDPSINYYLLFKDKKEIKSMINTNIKCNLFFTTDEFGILFKLFKYDGMDYEFVISQINSIDIDYVKEDFISQVIKSGNLNLIEKVLLGISNCDDCIENFKEKILGSINSKLVLDFFFKNYQDLYFNDGNDNWKYIRSLEVLEYYENKMQQLGRKLLVNNLNSSKIKFIESDIYILRFLLRGISNTQHYNVSDELSLESFRNLIVRLIKSFNIQDLLISLLSTYKFKKVEIDLFVNEEYLNERLLSWIYSNSKNIKVYKSFNLVFSNVSSQEEDNIVLFKGAFQSCFKLFYIIGEYDEIFKHLNEIYSITHLKNFFMGISNYRNQFVDMVINYYKEKNDNFFHEPPKYSNSKYYRNQYEYLLNSSFSFQVLLDSIMYSNNLPLLQHLADNHSYLFTNQKLNINPNNINIKSSLKNQFLKSLNYNQIELSEILYRFIDRNSISKNDISQINVKNSYKLKFNL